MKTQKRQEEEQVDQPCFIGSTTYSQTYQNWGASPAMKPAKQQPHVIDMKIRDATAYKDAYSSGKEGIPQFVRDHEEVMKKACLSHMQKGSLARLVEVPFKGSSVT